MSMLCDRICATKKMVSIFRHGINNDDIGPIAKASFEETPEMFLRAARHAELDLMTGVSSNIMCGQDGYYGTSSFDIMLNINKMTELSSKKLEEDMNVDSILEKMEDETIYCSKNNIQINDNVDYIDSKNTGNVDDSYEPGF